MSLLQTLKNGDWHVFGGLKTLPVPAFQTLAHVLILRPFVKLFLGLNVTGRENLRGLERFILVANHNSHLDILLLFCLLPIRQICRTRPVAALDYFSKRKVLFFLTNTLLRPIWIVRGERSRDPLRGIKEALDAGENVILFPEGTRGAPGQLEHFKSGIGRLVAQYPDAPIVPVFLSGAERALPRTALVPLPFWSHAVIGPPQTFAGTPKDTTRSLERAIAELSLAESGRRQKRRPKRRAASAVAFVGIDGSGKSSLSRKTALALSSEEKPGGKTGTATFFGAFSKNAGCPRFSTPCRTCLISDKLEIFENGAAAEIQPLVTEQLRGAVSRYAKRAKSLKIYKAPKMAELLLRNRLVGEAERWYRPDVIIMDGSPLLNIAAWATLYDDEPLDEETYAKAIAVLAGDDREIPRNDPVFARFPDLARMKRLGLNRLKPPDVAVFLDIKPSTACRRIAGRDEKRQVHETEEKLGRLREAYRAVCEVVKRRRGVPTAVIDGEETIEAVEAAALEFVRESLH